jgi:hypothetical protein
MPDFDWINERINPEPRPSLAWLNEERVLESPETLDRPLQMIRRPRRRLQLRALRQEKLEEFLERLPEPGETLHVVSNGSFDYWNFAPVTLQLLARKGRGPAAFYGSTWTMNRSNVLQLLSLYDQKKFSSVTMFSGLYFKRREPAVYTALASGLIDRGQRFLCFENHTKIMLLGAAPDWIVMEGSANFTANPRLEQNTISNDQQLFDFHKAWMEELLTKCSRKN